MNDNLASDFVALWQSELTAMAADRELRETWAKLMVLWAQTANAAMGGMSHDFASRSTSPAKPAGAPAAAAASRPGVDEIEQLHRRVAELEQRLARLEPAGDASPPAA